MMPISFSREKTIGIQRDMLSRFVKILQKAMLRCSCMSKDLVGLLTLCVVVKVQI